VAVVAVCTVLALLMVPHFTEANLVMVYLLGVALVATRLGRGPAVLASVLSVAAFDLFLVPPFYTFAVADTQYIVTFAVMLGVALLISTLTVRLHAQAQIARDREQRTAALFALSRDLSSIRGVQELFQAAAQHISALFATQVAVLATGADAALAVQVAVPEPYALDATELGVAQWVVEHGQMAGAGTDTLPGAGALYLPLKGSQRAIGVLAIRPESTRPLWEPEQLHLLNALASQTAVAVERAYLAEEAEQARVQVEAERLRNTLLSSVSHDLRTPLAAITGAASSLAEDGERFDAATRRDLAQTIFEEAARLNRLVGNLLDMTRLESGTAQVYKEWQSLEEVIGGALARMDAVLADRAVDVRLPAELPLVPCDGALIEQVLVNLLENAAKYTPPHSPIEIQVACADGLATVTVADRGSGFPAGDEGHVFDKFYRGLGAAHTGGAGLGLAISRAVVEAHGGRIEAANRPGGGALLSFTLPIEGTPPALERTPAEAPAPLPGTPP
jgi:two-component system sensor histidine kinase KdpD